MTDEDEIELPEDDLIRQLWEDRVAARDAGRLKLATAGDKVAIRSLMTTFVMRTEAQHIDTHDRWLKVQPDVAAWIKQAFLRILGGESADAVFGLKQSTGGRPPKTMREREADFELASEMFDLVSECKGKVSKAAEVYSKVHPGISPAKAEKIYRTWYANWPFAPHLRKNQEDISD